MRGAYRNVRFGSNGFWTFTCRGGEIGYLWTESSMLNVWVPIYFGHRQMSLYIAAIQPLKKWKKDGRRENMFLLLVDDLYQRFSNAQNWLRPHHFGFFVNILYDVIHQIEANVNRFVRDDAGLCVTGWFIEQGSTSQLTFWSKIL